MRRGIEKKMSIKHREIIFIPTEFKERIKLNQCPVCAKPKDKWNRRIDWRCCSTDCTEIYSKSTILWADLKSKVHERDKYTCLKCGYVPFWTMEVRELYKEEYELRSDFLGWQDKNTVRLIDKSKLIADHIMPIALGGAEFDIKNIQTLCSKCNKEKTKEDQGKIAELRRKIKLESKGQSVITI